MNKELVIALFNKDLSWKDKIDDDVKVVIYNKGDMFSYEGEFILNNIGREIHTYFYHIVENYDNLSDYVYFSQDYPFDHIENYVDIVNGGLQELNDESSQSFEEYWAFHWNTVGTMWDLPESKQFGGKVLICGSNGCPHSPDLKLDTVWSDVFDSEHPETYEFTPGAHFCVTRKQIHIRPKEFYQNIINLLESQPQFPWIGERFIAYIFNSTIK